MSDLYSENFYDRITPGSVQSARAILPLVFERFRPQSLVDFGCGSAAWLSVAQELGVADVTGVDGPWVGLDSLQIPPELFVRCDLSVEDPRLDRHFDMAMSTEVAEHLPPHRSAALVDLLCRSADLVVFSAAIPQQGGVGHINERWQSYWVGEFKRNGYGVLDIVRPRVWTDATVGECYRQNLLVFARGAEDEAAMIDVVHPFYAIRGLAVPRHPLVRATRAKLKLVRNWARRRLHADRRQDH